MGPFPRSHWFALNLLFLSSVFLVDSSAERQAFEDHTWGITRESLCSILLPPQIFMCARHGCGRTGQGWGRAHPVPAGQAGAGGVQGPEPTALRGSVGFQLPPREGRFSTRVRDLVCSGRTSKEGSRECHAEPVGQLRTRTRLAVELTGAASLFVAFYYVVQGFFIPLFV